MTTEATLKAETIMHVIDRWLSQAGGVGRYEPPTSANASVARDWASIRANLVIEVAAEIEGWHGDHAEDVPVPPELLRLNALVVPVHDNHRGEHFCPPECPRGKAVELLLGDERLVPFLNAARNKLSGPGKAFLPGESFPSEAELRLPRWKLAALYGVLTGLDYDGTAWMDDVLSQLHDLIQR